MHLPGAQSIDDEDTNLAKMVLAIGLVLEEDGQSATADAIYESMKPIISSKIMGPADMKGVCLIVLTVSAHSLLPSALEFPIKTDTPDSQHFAFTETRRARRGGILA